MSVIQDIREKYAKWAVIAIALALLGFILTDYFSAKNRMFGGGNSRTIGSVNGKKIEYIDFETRLKAMDEQAQQQAKQQGQEYTEQERYNNNQQLWNNDVDQIIMNAEFEKLGIDVGSKEFTNWLFGNNPPEELKRQFTDQQGNYDAAAAQNAINQMKRSANPVEKQQLEAFLSAMEYNRKVEKFRSLLTSSVYVPKWFVEKKNSENALLAKTSYVQYPFSKIGDTTIKVSDKEIEEYVNKRKETYKQEAARNIAYVVFDASPTVEDSAAVRDRVAELKDEFATTENPVTFLSKYGSTMEYYDGYNGESNIHVPNKDSIFNLSKGAVFGPYQDQGSYVLAKLIDSRSMPDSVKARHILIQTYNPQAGQQILDDSTAKNRIDSIETAIKGGARFDSLAVKYSDDKGSGEKGGLLSNPNNPSTNYFTAGAMVPEFNDFCFEGKTGEKKVVKTVFGYHLVEILDQKNFQPHYKVAYFAKNIIAGDETDQRVSEQAYKFANESKDLKSFEESVAKSNGQLQKFDATNIKPIDISITGLNQYGSSRQLVREIYKADKGDVLDPQKLGDLKTGYKYVVAVVTDVLKEGTQPAYIARPFVETAIRNKKKADEIKKTIGAISTLEAAAQKINDTIANIDSLRLDLRNNYAFSPNVVGAIFNSSNKGKVITEPLVGANAVYVIRVNEITTTPVMTAGSIEEQQKSLIANAKQFQQFYSNPSLLLRKIANIKDNRSEFY